MKSTPLNQCSPRERPHCERVLRQVRHELNRVKTVERWAQLIGEEIRLCELLGIEPMEQMRLF